MNDEEQERRKSARIAVSCPIRARKIDAAIADELRQRSFVPQVDELEGSEGLIFWDSLDISAGGIRIIGDFEVGETPAQGDHYAVEIKLPDDTKVLTFLAKIMWATKEGSERMVAGMEFETIDASCKQELEIALKKHRSF